MIYGWFEKCYWTVTEVILQSIVWWNLLIETENEFMFLIEKKQLLEAIVFNVSTIFWKIYEMNLEL